MSICRHPAADAPVRNLIKLQLRSCQIGSSDFPKFRNATVKLVKFHIELSTVQFHNHSFKQPRKREGMGRVQAISELPGNQWRVSCLQLRFFRQETSFLCFVSVLGTGLIQTRQQDFIWLYDALCWWHWARLKRKWTKWIKMDNTKVLKSHTFRLLDKTQGPFWRVWVSDSTRNQKSSAGSIFPHLSAQHQETISLVPN